MRAQISDYFPTVIFQKTVTTFKSPNMPQPSNRAAQHICWLTTHVIHHTKRRALLLDAMPGDDRWFDAVPNRLLPTRCRAGVERRQFKHAMRKVAFAYRDSHLHDIAALDKLDRPADSGSDSAPTDEEGDDSVTPAQ